MSLEELEEMIRKYVSAGVAVVVIVLSPGSAEPGTVPPDPSVNVIEPEATAPDGPDPAPDPRSEPDATDRNGTAPGSHPADPKPADPPAEDRTGADGRDPAREDEPEPDSESGRTGGTEGSGDESSTGGGGTGGGSAGGSGAAEGGSESSPGGTGGAGRGGAAAEGSGSEGTTAAEVHGWGTPNREDDFTGGLEQWSIYDGPGHAGEGRRSPAAVTVENGIMTITGDSSGTTAGMAWNPGQKYGRWEGRVRAPASDPSYNALLLLWPDAEDFPVGGEIDFMEMLDHTRRTTDIFIHYGSDNSQVNGQVEIDGTEWHNWAVEWTPDAITAYVDGKEWYRTTDTDIFPPRPMHLCVQLDWFPEGGSPQESYMHVDWVRQYSFDGGGEGTAESPAGGNG